MQLSYKSQIQTPFRFPKNPLPQPTIKPPRNNNKKPSGLFDVVISVFGQRNRDNLLKEVSLSCLFSAMRS